jgi:hypothetical protein
METGQFIGLCVFIMVTAGILRTLYEHHLLNKNPEAWRAMKAAQEDAKERKRKAMGSAAMGGISIARMFLKK